MTYKIIVKMISGLTYKFLKLSPFVSSKKVNTLFRVNNLIKIETKIEFSFLWNQSELILNEYPIQKINSKHPKKLFLKYTGNLRN